VAARETAGRFGKVPQSGLVLKYRMYVDDATTRANTMVRLKALSFDMKAVGGQGSLIFKETLMSKDKETGDGKRHKVPGLIWKTERYQLRIDMKLNLGARKACLHLQENVELKD
jgi:hypothetical protein